VALAGAKTASGKPILANDPHLEFSCLALYLVHLKAPGMDVTGAAIVGLPGVIVGHNDRIAWGVHQPPIRRADLYHEKEARASLCSNPLSR